ncbi:glycosyltransferase family 2 protein [Falsirhodobacter algicola]|uniref:Glycosyltransferase n=1 Tax=Falsirhodobacter algicola TaxID=2692330 RepID=A0A8J8SLC3_9RHOB|nr:glycosyltransferase [Falsirhodobacter algicola]QUS36327.1 glycosyltransferase [Falsirhodobacter algicola]
MTLPTRTEQLQMIRASELMDPDWYRETYRDVALLRLDPAVHYFDHGAAMGRNPGKAFDTKYYLRNAPGAAESGLNPLVHHILSGQTSATKPPRAAGLRHMATLRTKLLSLGFTEPPLTDLRNAVQHAKVPDTRALASRELAMWEMRQKSQEGYAAALTHLAAARADARDHGFRSKLSVLELLCHHHLGDDAGARACYERAALAGEVGPDMLLARTNIETDPEMRLTLINAVLGHYGIAPVALGGNADQPLYDRMTGDAHPAVGDGPKVTVLIAAYDAADTLPSALRSLQEQTWRNLEILVLDDCSPTPGTREVAERFAAEDPRIRYIRMEENRGAYVARNRGLDEATGEYITLHDADDWSHPAKIETQIRHLLAHPDVVGCLSEQARAMSDLTFSRWAGEGVFIIPNTSSFMFHAPRMRDALGYWDSVRFSADNELIRRMQRVFGKESVTFLETGPLSFQRDSATSIIADAVLGVNGFFMGVRREYLHAQSHYRHQEGADLRFGNDWRVRPFPVPVVMRADRAERLSEAGHLDVVIAGDLRTGSASVRIVLDLIARHQAAGRTVGMFELNRYRATGVQSTRIATDLRAEAWARGVRILSFGEAVRCETLFVIDANVLKDTQRYMPSVTPGHVRVIDLPDADDTPPRDVAAGWVERSWSCTPEWEDAPITPEQNEEG